MSERLPFPREEYRNVGPALGPEAEGARVDFFLARAFPFNSRPKWATLCKEGRLLVNERPVRAAHRLRCGDQVVVHHPEDEEPEADTRIALLAEDAGVMAVYKPGNLPMHESGLYWKKTFGALLEARFGKEWAPVHRLDRETSGIVVCAATPELRRQLTEDFLQHRVAKRYLALVLGTPAWETLVVDQPIDLVDDGRRPRYLVREGGLPAVTELTTLERGARTTLVEARPRTGRTNQIRVHLAWAGHPIVGDKVYHPDERVFDAYHRLGDTPETRALAGFPRQALHAAGIALTHPGTGRTFAVEAPLPDDLAQPKSNASCV